MPTKMRNYLKRAMETPLKKTVNEAEKKAVKKFEDKIKLVLDNNWDSIMEDVEQSDATLMYFTQALKNVAKPGLFKDILKS